MNDTMLTLERLTTLRRNVRRFNFSQLVQREVEALWLRGHVTELFNREVTDFVENVESLINDYSRTTAREAA